ncbi:class I SAM-dependent methyltransferase [Bacillus sp. FJAT-45350]|uniref:class I SAM-dependent methyltransferase n=1 Tax=Bacillus sp. FJAT-45350 TaxID=2011014 RepID=UPI000BB79F73|nr:class I SAM-dependent methyltransferase [Bacillus sp. FJAT-45350]
MEKENKKDLDLQHPHWENFWGSSQNPELLSEPPSEAAKQAVKEFKKEGITKILELGGGLGRDTLYFATEGFQVYVLEYAESGVQTIQRKAIEEGVSSSIFALQHDVRDALPFENNFFEGCFSHMLYCMAFTNDELAFLSEEIKRVLKKDGLNMFTVRNTNDPMYKTGVHIEGNMFEIHGFIINFFDKYMVQSLSKGYELQSLTEFEEGSLPKRLYNVILKKG